MRNVSKQIKLELNESSNDIDNTGMFSFIPDAMAFNENSFVKSCLSELNEYANEDREYIDY